VAAHSKRADVAPERSYLVASSSRDLVAFTAAGAYGAVMSTTYNSRLLVPEVLVADGRFAIIRARPSYDALLSLDTIPEWLSLNRSSGGLTEMIENTDMIENPGRKRGVA